MNNPVTTGQVMSVRKMPKGRLRVWVAVFCAAAYFIAFLDRVNVSVLIADPLFTKVFGIAKDKGAQGLLLSAFLFTYGVSCFLVGPVIERFGPKKSLIVGLLSWAVLMCTMGAVSSFIIILLCRALLGLGEAVLGPGVSKLVQTWFPVQERAKANGLWYVGLQVAYVVATPLIAWWIVAVGWRGSHYILGLLGVAPVALCVYYVYDHPSMHPQITTAELDYIGTKAKSSTLDASKVKLSLGFLRNSTFWYLTIVYGVANAGSWGFIAWIPSYLKSTLGFSWKAMGSLAMLPYILGTLAVMASTPLMDKLNRRALFTLWGYVVFILLIGLAMWVGSPLAAVAVLSLAYAAHGLRVPALWTILQNVTSKEEVATATGFFNGFAYVLASLTPYGVGVCYNLTGSLKTGFYFLAITSILGLLACIPLVRHRL